MMRTDEANLDALGGLVPATSPLGPQIVPKDLAGQKIVEDRRILVIEDDAPLARLLSSWLQKQAFQVEVAHDGDAATAYLAEGRFDLVILDLNLPKRDGLTLLTELRDSENAQLPVIVISGRRRREDTVATLNQGADDYLMKPFSLHELTARTQALLRRHVGNPLERKPAASLTINRNDYSAQRDGQRIDLTPREFAILDYMMQNAGTPISRATLMREVWNTPHDPGTNIVDVYMKYLRDKIDADGKEKLIRTVRGVGYMLRYA